MNSIYNLKNIAETITWMLGWWKAITNTLRNTRKGHSCKIFKCIAVASSTAGVAIEHIQVVHTIYRIKLISESELRNIIIIPSVLSHQPLR